MAEATPDRATTGAETPQDRLSPPGHRNGRRGREHVADGAAHRRRTATSGPIDPAAMERISAALRDGQADAPAFLNTLASKLEEVLPMHARATRVRDGLFRKPARVAGITVELGACHYILQEDADGNLAASCAMVSSSTVIATDRVALDVWFDLLARDLAAFAYSSAVARRALSRLVA